jgi:predicted O-methyltransferase YrrM
MQQNNIKSYLEVGTWYGQSLIYPLMHGVKCVSVDVKKQKIAEEVISNLPTENFSWVIEDSTVYLPKLKDKSFDHVHIDGNHRRSIASLDIKQACRIARKIVTVHDTDNPKYPFMRDEVEKQGFKTKHYNHSEAEYGLGVIKIS